MFGKLKEVSLFLNLKLSLSLEILTNSSNFKNPSIFHEKLCNRKESCTKPLWDESEGVWPCISNDNSFFLHQGWNNTFLLEQHAPLCHSLSGLKGLSLNIILHSERLKYHFLGPSKDFNLVNIYLYLSNAVIEFQNQPIIILL